MSEKKEYIERGALSERAEIIRKKMLTEKHEPFTIDIMNDFADLLDKYAKDIPAADVEPVVRGEWKWVESGVWICTLCKTRRYTNTSRYCPECGAHMGRSGSGE